MNINEIMAGLEARHPGEKEFLQAVKEVLISVEDVYNQHPEFEKARIIERMVEPDRIFTFRVTWVDDKGEVQNNIDPEIPRLRADLQKRTYHTSHGWRQGRLRLLPPRQERR